MKQININIDPWDNGNLEEGAIDHIIKYFALDYPMSYVKSINADDSIVSRSLLAGDNLDSELVSLMNENPENIDVFAGFDLAGKLHLGNGLVLKQILWYKSKGCNIHIPLVDYEALSARNVSLTDARIIARESSIPILESLGFDRDEIYLRSKIDSILDYVCLFSSQLDFREVSAIYNRNISPGEYIASLIMAADILRFSSDDKKVLTVYGIDEMPHIKFTNYLANRYGLKPVSATFNKLIHGLSVKKMSKSRPAENIFLADSQEEIKSKLKKSNRDNCHKIIKSASYLFLGEIVDDFQDLDTIVSDFSKRIAGYFRGLNVS